MIISIGYEEDSFVKAFNVIKDLENEHYLILENEDSYDISEKANLGITLRILKSTLVGTVLGSLIERKELLENIIKFIDRLILENLTMDGLRESINIIKKDYFRRGARAKLNQIGGVLFVDPYEDSHNNDRLMAMEFET